MHTTLQSKYQLSGGERRNGLENYITIFVKTDAQKCRLDTAGSGQSAVAHVCEHNQSNKFRVPSRRGNSLNFRRTTSFRKTIFLHVARWWETIISSTLLLSFRYHASSSYQLQFSKGKVHLYQIFVIYELLKSTFDNSHTILSGKCSILSLFMSMQNIS